MYLGIVLHTHLPYVINHGRWPHGTDWLNEATAECYIPLLNILYKLVDEGVTPNITVGLTPIICEQLNNENFHKEFVDYLDVKIAHSLDNIDEFKQLGQERYEKLAKYWLDYYTNVKEDFINKYKYDIVGSFRRLQEIGAIEIITCAATHGYLPLIGYDRCVNGQIQTAISSYEKYFSKKPLGIWLPECAYRPSYEWSSHDNSIEKKRRKGIEEFVADNGIKYFIVNTHLVRGGKSLGVYIWRYEALKRLWTNYQDNVDVAKKKKMSIYHSYALPVEDNNVVVFSRDDKTSMRVWCGNYGYPGNGAYLDFHKKHYPGGLRYWRVTDPKADMGLKEIYELSEVEGVLDKQSSNFLQVVCSVVKKQGGNAVVVTPFDTELFGHWWFEGCEWLYKVIKKASESDIKLTKLGEYSRSHDPKSMVSLPEGSWGKGGFHYIWLNDTNSWTWDRIYEVEKKFLELVDLENNKIERVLKMMAREVLLLESSDWQFLISTCSAKDYASLRFTEHYDTFMKLNEIVHVVIDNKELGENQERYLNKIEERDNIFKDIDLNYWRRSNA